jgi:hypothetical protein
MPVLAEYDDKILKLVRQLVVLSNPTRLFRPTLKSTNPLQSLTIGIYREGGCVEYCQSTCS